MLTTLLMLAPSAVTVALAAVWLLVRTRRAKRAAVDNEALLHVWEKLIDRTHPDRDAVIAYGNYARAAHGELDLLLPAWIHDIGYAANSELAELISSQYGEQEASLVRVADDPDASEAASHLAVGLDELFRTLGPPPMSQAGDTEVVLVGDGGGQQ
ncbi:hypothetical protein [Kitasatospora purpeofusca]|uniref:hypothetical protein n=1 Tax=Kitasatospora purpeofusca TaxID=67352 RepID=UPI003820C363